MRSSNKVMVLEYYTPYLEVFILLLINNGFEVIGYANNGTQLIESINPENLPDIVIFCYKTTKPEILITACWIKKHYPNVRVVMNIHFNNPIPFYEMTWMDIEGLILSRTRILKNYQ